MRRSIYRHIREETLEDGFSTTGLFWITISYIILAIVWEADFSIFMPPVFFFCWWILRIMRNIRDNYIMDKLSAQKNEEIGKILGDYGTFRTTKKSIRLKLKFQSKNDFLYQRSDLSGSISYKLFLSNKYEFKNDKLYGGWFTSAKEDFPDSTEEFNKLPIIFPILSDHYRLSSFDEIDNIGSYCCTDIKTTSEKGGSILLIKGKRFWRPYSEPWYRHYDWMHSFEFIKDYLQWIFLDSIFYSWKHPYNKPSIYIAQIEVYDSLGNISDDYDKTNGKYVLITTNELCLFDILSDQEDQ